MLHRPLLRDARPAAPALRLVLRQKRLGPLQLSVLILPARGPNFVRSNLRTRTILDARGRAPNVAGQVARPLLGGEARGRSLASSKTEQVWQFARLRWRLLPAQRAPKQPVLPSVMEAAGRANPDTAVAERHRNTGGNGDQLVRLANDVGLGDGGRHRRCNLLSSDSTPRR